MFLGIAKVPQVVPRVLLGYPGWCRVFLGLAMVSQVALEVFLGGSYE